MLNDRDLGVRVLKWNEKVHNVGESEGVFFVRFQTATEKLRPGRRRHTLTVKEDHEFTVFNLAYLSTRESTELLVSKATKETTGPLLSEETNARLSKDIASYLLSCFKFDPQKTEKPIIVIMVDFYYSRTTLGCRSSPPKSGSKKRKFTHFEEEWEWVVPRKELKWTEAEEIRGVLRSALGEPMVLCVKERVESEPLGLYQVIPKVELMKEFNGDDSKEEEEEEEEKIDTCSICLEGFCRETTVAKTPCSHLFHQKCLFAWLPTKNGCPLCRSICSTIV